MLRDQSHCAQCWRTWGAVTAAVAGTVRSRWGAVLDDQWQAGLLTSLAVGRGGAEWQALTRGWVRAYAPWAWSWHRSIAFCMVKQTCRGKILRGAWLATYSYVVGAGLGELPDQQAIAHVPLMRAGNQAVPLTDNFPQEAGEAVAAPFFLSQAFGPVPEKLVKRIQALDFIDMADLLPDNLELKRRGDNSTDKEASNTGKRRPREVSQLLTWVQCFITYVAIVAARHPDRMKDLLAYMRLIVREAQRHKSDGWRQYDVMFRKYAASHPSVQWGQPLPSMYASFFLTPTLSSSPCEHCLEGDHISSQCALAPYPPPLFSSGSLWPPSALRASPYPTPMATQDFTSRPICRRWNQGVCRGFPLCSYKHACSRCGKRGHKVADALTSQTILAQLPHVLKAGLANHGSMG